MVTAAPHRVDWSLLWSQRAFRFFFTAMFVSLFGSGMNFISVSWYIMSATHSTLAVSWQVIVVTLPGLIVPFVGGVLIDRLDRLIGEARTARPAQARKVARSNL